MKLYEAPNKSYIRFADEILYFDHVDGFYSYCKDSENRTVYLAVFAEVELLEDLKWELND